VVEHLVRVAVTRSPNGPSKAQNPVFKVLAKVNSPWPISAMLRSEGVLKAPRSRIGMCHFVTPEIGGRAVSHADADVLELVVGK
jgi:hypothetical protein